MAECDWGRCARDPEVGLDLPFAHAALCQPHYDEARRRWRDDDRTCAYCGKGTDAYPDAPQSRAWYRRSDGDWAHRGCSPRP